MPFENDCLTIPLMIDSTELLLSLITCVGIRSRKQVLFEEEEDIIFLMLSFDRGVNWGKLQWNTLCFSSWRSKEEFINSVLRSCILPMKKTLKSLFFKRITRRQYSSVYRKKAIDKPLKSWFRSAVLFYSWKSYVWRCRVESYIQSILIQIAVCRLWDQSSWTYVLVCVYLV